MSNKNIIFNKDLEDTEIDQGLTSNIEEALDYYQLTEKTIDERTEPFLNEKVEEDYHNSYYNKGEHRTRSLRMNNIEWHKMVREQQLNSIEHGN